MKYEQEKARAEIRKSGIAARDRMRAAQRMILSAQISVRIAASDVFQQAQTVMLYKGIRGEVRLDVLENIAETEGKRLSYPLCTGEGRMIALAPCSSQAWQSGAYGILEPIRAFSEEVTPEEIDLVICPCTAFDAACRRMGMGAGYYDRFLPACTGAHIVAAAFEVQKTAQVPAGSWDVPMEKIFTEEKVYVRNG